MTQYWSYGDWSDGDRRRAAALLAALHDSSLEESVRALLLCLGSAIEQLSRRDDGTWDSELVESGARMVTDFVWRLAEALKEAQ